VARGYTCRSQRDRYDLGNLSADRDNLRNLVHARKRFSLRAGLLAGLRAGLRWAKRNRYAGTNVAEDMTAVTHRNEDAGRPPLRRQRRLPLHPRLIKLGLLRFVQEQRQPVH
jgi:hypothetical protein